MTVPYYGRKDRDAFLRRWAEIVRESYGLHDGIMFERMIQNLYVDLESPTCPAWEHDSE